ncbi:MAG TPA: hypothetical protein VNN08_14355, partial [Thermoanaerobaculia bacterium]|nr:hypothetical protein [Thermoanaerobaculia bacterium]
MSAAARPLPGIRFDAQPHAASDVLPRMDVALLAGFAASGPVHTPVPVEAPSQFAEIFGDDLVVARDSSGREPRYAYLAPAVRAFFRNGGRRCWIVRLAHDATPNRFVIPGLATLDDSNAQSDAFAWARSPGSWSDDLRVSANLVRRPVQFAGFNVDPMNPEAMELDVAVSSPRDLVPGDLLRLTWSDRTLYFFVGSVASIPGPRLRLTAMRFVWLAS